MTDVQRNEIPPKGARIELVEPRLGVRRHGTVFYSDQIQVLVKWDDGDSASLRPGFDDVRILEAPRDRPSRRFRK